MSNGKSNDPAGTTDPAAEELDLRGRTIGDFRVLRKLGQGGMGQVYLAEQVSLKRPVALKILRPDLASAPRAMERFEQEATSVAKLTHANIVQVYAFGVEDGLAYMALEYVEGKNLKDVVTRKGPLEWPIAVHVMRQVAAALQRASEAGIIHRDVKPENILVTRKTEVKVADFGLARVTEGDRPLNLTQTGVTMGTPLYMSPEQVEGKPVDCRTDVYSFGVTCYFCLCGEPPFSGKTPFDVALQHVQKQPVPLSKIRPDIPPALCDVIHKMMAKAPADRYQNGKELLRDLSKLRETTGSLVRALQDRPPSSGEQAAVKDVAPTVEKERAAPTVRAEKAVATTAGTQKAAAAEPARVVLPAVLGGLAVLTVLAAAGGGAALAWARWQREGPLPHGQKIAPADADVNDNLMLPSKEERRLHEMVEGYLHPAKGKLEKQSEGHLAAGLGLCMELGQLYLDGNRLKEADAHFSRLEKLNEPRYRMLGEVGRGIVLALEDSPKLSNAYFLTVFGPTQREIVTTKLGKEKGKKANAVAWLKENVEPGLAPIAPLRQSPRWRYWLARARWYNNKNGLPESEVSYWLVRNVPVKDGEPEAPRDKDKPRKDKG